MKLYHGSTVDIQQIDLEKSRPNKDFGRAFYLSDNELVTNKATSHSMSLSVAFST